MTSPFKVLISGGGPAGLVAAHSLHLAGVDFEVLEARDEVANDQGASLVLQPGSLRVMHQFGLYEKLHEIGGEMTHKTAFSWDGRQIGDSTSIQYMKDNHGSGPLAFHRAQLIQTIYDGLPDAAKPHIHTGKKIENVTSNDTGVTVTCTDGTSYTASVLIGADGVHSRTRRQMRKLVLESSPQTDDDSATLNWDPESPYYADYKCLWCSFPLPTATGETTETHNKDRSVMYLSGKTRGWIFLYEKLPQRTYARCSYDEADCLAFADTFADYPITSTLKVKDVFATRLTVGMSNLEEGVIQHWSYGRIALVGDAAHKYTPNGGLGFNNGIQDVVALCNGLVAAVHSSPSSIPDSETLTHVFETYQSQRRDLASAGWIQSAHTTREQADANWLYYFIGHYVMWFRFIQYFLLDWFAPRQLRESLVLDYVEGEEPFVGAVSWAHPIKKRSVTAKVAAVVAGREKMAEAQREGHVLNPAL